MAPLYDRSGERRKASSFLVMMGYFGFQVSGSGALVSGFKEQSSGFRFQGAGLRFQGCSALLHASGARKQVSRVSVQIFSMILSPDFERSDP